VLALCLLPACQTSGWAPLGWAGTDALAGFRPAGGRVTVTASVVWINDRGEIMLIHDGKIVPVFTGYLRQPVRPGDMLTVTGLSEGGGRNRILAERIVTADARVVFPAPRE
jgi:hypothetical protein